MTLADQCVKRVCSVEHRKTKIDLTIANRPGRDVVLPLVRGNSFMRLRGLSGDLLRTKASPRSPTVERVWCNGQRVNRLRGHGLAFFRRGERLKDDFIRGRELRRGGGRSASKGRALPPNWPSNSVTPMAAPCVHP